MTVLTQKLIIRHQSTVVIEFDVNDKEISPGMQRIVKGIQHDIAKILGVHHRAVEIEQGQLVAQRGFHMKIQVDSNQDELPQYQAGMQQAISSGHLDQIFMRHWKLTNNPSILVINLQCAFMEQDSNGIDETLKNMQNL